MKRKKWKPETVEKAKQAVKNLVAEGHTVKSAMKTVGIDPVKYYGTVRKTKEAKPKRTYKPRKNKEVSIQEVAANSPIIGHFKTSKTMLVIGDINAIASLIESLS